MSIINDALQKALKERDTKVKEQKETLRPATVEIPISEVIPRKKYRSAVVKKGLSLKNVGKLILISILVVVIAGYIAITKFTNRPINKLVPLPVQEKPVEKESPAHAQTMPIPATATTAQETDTDNNVSEWVLSGIVHGEGSPMAVINGSVYMAGDEIGKVKVIEISEDTVVLEKDTEKIRLRVK
jgi:hypothetical protein